MPYNKEKVRNWMANVGIIIFSVVLCLFFIELGLRTFRPLYFAQPIEAYEYDNDLAYRLRPGAHLFISNDYQQEIRTNELGTLNFQDNFSEYEIIIFALGDSYTQGLGVANDSSYPFQLDLLLNFNNKGNYSKRYGVVNLALGPYGGKQQLITLKRFSRDLGKPDIVLYLGYENDYSDDLLFESGIRHKNPVMNNPRYGSLYYPLKWFFIDTEVGKRIKYFVQEVIFKAKADKTQNEEKQARSAAEMEKNQIEKIVKTARELGAVPILSWASVGDSYDWLKSWAEQNDILFADWRPGALSVSRAIPDLPWENSHSGEHWRSWLNFVIARSFAQQIEKIKTSPEVSSD